MEALIKFYGQDLGRAFCQRERKNILDSENGKYKQTLRGMFTMVDKDYG